MSSTDACVKAQLVIITLPSTRCNVLPRVKVDKAAVLPAAMFILIDDVAPITSMAGNVTVVNAGIPDNVIRP